MIIPGGGLTKNGGLPPWVKARLDLALETAGEHAEFLLLSGGTVHKPPPLDEKGYPLFEAHVGARYLAARGIPARRIFTEICSYDTIGNAFFSRVVHVQPARWKQLLVITSSFHIDRTEAAFNWIYNLDPLPVPFELEYAAAPDTGLSPAALTARKQREKNSLQSLQKIQSTITTLAQLHHWLFTEHNAYNCSADRESLSPEERISY